MRRAVTEPYAPLNVLKPVATDIWIADGPEIGFGFMGLRLPFPTRMSMIRLDDGSLWLHSPIEPNSALIAGLQVIGPVRYLIAPNSLHYWWIPDWKKRFPDVEVHAAPGLERSAKRPLPIDCKLGATPARSWSGAID